MSFLKVTEKTAGTDKWIYVNVEYIIKAEYNTVGKTMRVFLNLPSASKGVNIIDLAGDEAEAALEILKNVP